MSYDARGGSGYGGQNRRGSRFGKSKGHQDDGWRVPEAGQGPKGVIRFLPEPIAGIIKVDETENEYRFRVCDPEGFVKFRNTDFGGKLPEGVSVIYAETPENQWMVQSVRFEKEIFGFEEAQSWLRGHQDLFAGGGAQPPEIP